MYHRIENPIVLMKNIELEDLIIKFLEQTISVNERKQLMKWIQENKENSSYFKERIRMFTDKTENIVFNSDKAFITFLTSIDNQKKKRKHTRRFVGYAATFLGFLFVSYFFYQNQIITNKVESSFVQQKKDKNGSEIIITLADGSEQFLSSSSTDTLVTNANGNIVANTIHGVLDYTNTNDLEKNELAFNEVYVPYGQKLKIILSDETEVWLNSGSRFKFPRDLNLVTNTRMVYLDGEAFFNVAKNKKIPFIVNTEKIDIKVLGTQFNVSSYEQDDVIATTLVEGSVDVYQTNQPNKHLFLTPNDQVSYKKNNNSFKKAKVDTDIYTSWMHNSLVIDEMSFEQIMTKIERSYNVIIVNKVPELNDEIFKGEFKNENIDDILKTISMSKPFNYNINKNLITITE